MHDDLEPFDAKLLEVGDEFGTLNLFNNENRRPYTVTRVSDTSIYYTHRDFSGAETSLSRGQKLSSFKMNLRIGTWSMTPHNKVIQRKISK